MELEHTSQKDRWTDIAREMVQQEILRLEGSRYPLLKLDAGSDRVTAGNRIVEVMQLACEDKNSLVTSGKRATADKLENVAMSDTSILKDAGTEYKTTKQIGKLYSLDTELFSRLKELRKRIASKEKVPPYIVFADTSLKQMATQMPLNEKELLDITGVGEYKLQKYGSIFLTEIKEYLNATNQLDNEVNKTEVETQDNKKEKVMQCIISLREEFIRLTKEQLGTEISDKYIEETWSEILSCKE